MTGNTANLSKAIRAILPLQISCSYKVRYHGGRPCRKLKVDNDAPNTINPVGTEAPPSVNRRIQVSYLRNWQYPISIQEEASHQAHQAYLSLVHPQQKVPS